MSWNKKGPDKMKIVIIKGSPHKKGSSNMLAEQFIKGAQEAGHTIIEMDAAHMDIRPCFGCGNPSMTKNSRHMEEAYQLGKSL